jgi:hypothetical protein
VLREWAAWSYAYRRDDRRLTPIDWSAGWEGVRGLLERAGLELDRIQAYSTFTMYSNLETRHRPRRTSNLLGVLADWGVRHARAMLVGGLVTGVALAVVNTLWPGWYDRPGFWVLLAVVTVVLLPVAGWNGRTQYRLNARRPENIVVFPSQWRTLLRREDPGIVVLFLHELSHVRHNDAGRRRVVRTYAGAGRFVAFFDAGMVFAAAASAGVQLLLFAVVAGCGVIGVRAASRALPLV